MASFNYGYPTGIFSKTEMMCMMNSVRARLRLSPEYLCKEGIEYQSEQLFLEIQRRHLQERYRLREEYIQKQIDLERERETSGYNVMSVYLSWALEAIPKVPEELLSSLEIYDEAIDLEQRTIKDTREHLDKVKQHERKYGTMSEKILTYLKT